VPGSVWALLGGLAAAGALYASASWIDPYYLEVLINIGINVILAVSLNLVNGYTGQFSLGHAGFMSVGAYTAAAITMFAAPRLPPPLIFLLALLAGGAAAAIAGFLVGMPSLRLRGDYLAIVTLGFGEIIRVIFQNIDALGGALGLNGIPPYTNIFWVGAWVTLTIFVVVCLVHSTFGRGFLAVHDDEIAAAAVGLNPTKYKIVAFVVGAFFAGVAGGLYGSDKLTISPAGFDFTKSIEIVVMVILGGMGNTLGVIAAAVVLTLLPEVLRPVADYRMILYSLILIILMIVRPEGLFNLRRAK
jgi:branched-chain amino acid transport system permease protein